MLAENGTLYLGVNQFNICVSRQGEKVWERGSADVIDASPAVAANAIIYCASPWRNIFGLQTNGVSQWEILEDSAITASPAIGNDGTIYATEGMYLVAIVATNSAPPAKSSWPMFRANPRHTGRVPDGDGKL